MPLALRHPVVAIWVGISALLVLIAASWSIPLGPLDAGRFGFSPLLVLRDFSEAVLAGAAAATMAVPRRRHPVAVALVAAAFAIYGYCSYLIRGGFVVELLKATLMLSATRGALVAVTIVSLWPLGRGRKPVVPILVSLCAAVMALSGLAIQAWPSWIRPWFWIDPGQRSTRFEDLDIPARIEHLEILSHESWWFTLTLYLENLSITLLLGLGIGLLCGDLARRLSAFLRGDPAVTIFWAMVGVLFVMTVVPTELVLREQFAVIRLTLVPLQDDPKVRPISDADQFVLGIVLKAVFIVGGAAFGGLIGAVSSREGGPTPGPSRPP